MVISAQIRIRKYQPQFLPPHALHQDNPEKAPRIRIAK
jgi:hypothetical protein